MVKPGEAKLDRVFAALSHPIRRSVLTRLARGDEASVTELAEPFDVSLMAVSRHIGVLEEAGLVVKRRDGRVQRCSFDGAAMGDAAAWIEEHRRFWEEQLDALGDYLARTGNPPGGRTGNGTLEDEEEEG